MQLALWDADSLINYDVFLDGETIPHAFAASEERGLVIVFATTIDSKGRTVGVTDDYGNRLLCELHGNVVIHKKKPSLKLL